MNGYYFGYFNPWYWLIILGSIIGILAQSYVNKTYKKYSLVKNQEGWTGDSIAKTILSTHDLSFVRVSTAQPGILTDHYDPKNKVVALSQQVYSGQSISAIAVASHEVGHALQHHGNFKFIALRNTILPFAIASGKYATILLVIGLIFFPSGNILTTIGLVGLGVIFLFQLITLPVEFDASRRAMKVLKDNHYLNNEELAMAKQVLTAAALTYVAAAITSLLNLLYYSNVSKRRR